MMFDTETIKRFVDDIKYDISYKMSKDLMVRCTVEYQDHLEYLDDGTDDADFVLIMFAVIPMNGKAYFTSSDYKKSKIREVIRKIKIREMYDD